MTVISAKRNDDGSINFAADSMISSGQTRLDGKPFKVSKLFQNDRITVGCSGECWESSLLQVFCRNHHPAQPTEVAVVDFIVEFEDWMRKRDTDFRSSVYFLMAIEDKLFDVQGRMRVMEANEFAATGCGWQYALTALHLGKTARESVELTCKLDALCALPCQEVTHSFTST